MAAASSGVVYSLTNYTCDGTVATAIDTGIKLFDSTAFPEGFIVELDATSSTYSALGSFIRCRSANKVGNTWPGICIRWIDVANRVQVQANGNAKLQDNMLGVRTTYVIEYKANGQCDVWIDASKSTYNLGTININDTFCIGGEKDASNNWNTERFASLTIHSLKVINRAAQVASN